MTDISKEVRERLERRAQELEDDLKCILGDAFCRRFAADIRSIPNQAAQQAAALTKALTKAHAVFGAERDRLGARIREQAARIEALEGALKQAADNMDSVTIFVTSRERIKRPEGEELWAEAKSNARALLTEGTEE